MATESRRPDPPLEETLFAEGHRFDFFQAVRLLERLAPHREPVGQQYVDPADEVARFRAHPSLSFPASEIYEVVRAQDQAQPPQMTVTFMGLTGPQGVLPRHYTALLLERLRQHDEVLRDFFDLFNHRLVSLFYRAWEKYRFPFAYERAALGKQENDRFTQYLFDLIGMGTDGLRERMEAIEDQTLLCYTGLLAQHPRSASALQALLQDYFDVPVTVVQCRGQWRPLSARNRTRLGHGQNNTLGSDTVLGRHVWDQQGGFRVRLGPLPLATFLQFLPSARSFQVLVQLTRFFAGREYDFDVQLILQASDIPECRLGKTGKPTPQLGRTAWLPSKAWAHDADDAVFAGRASKRRERHVS